MDNQGLRGPTKDLPYEICLVNFSCSRAGRDLDLLCSFIWMPPVTILSSLLFRFGCQAFQSMAISRGFRRGFDADSPRLSEASSTSRETIPLLVVWSNQGAVGRSAESYREVRTIKCRAGFTHDRERGISWRALRNNLVTLDLCLLYLIV